MSNSSLTKLKNEIEPVTKTISDFIEMCAKNVQIYLIVLCYLWRIKGAHSVKSKIVNNCARGL